MKKPNAVFIKLHAWMWNYSHHYFYADSSILGETYVNLKKEGYKGSLVKFVIGILSLNDAVSDKNMNKLISGI